MFAHLKMSEIANNSVSAQPLNAEIIAKTESLMDEIIKLKSAIYSSIQFDCNIYKYEIPTVDEDSWIDSVMFFIFADNEIARNVVSSLKQKMDEFESKSNLLLPYEKYAQNVILCIICYISLILNSKQYDLRKNVIWCMAWYLLKYFETTNPSNAFNIVLDNETLSIKGEDPIIIASFLSDVTDVISLYKNDDPISAIVYRQKYSMTHKRSPGKYSESEIEFKKRVDDYPKRIVNGILGKMPQNYINDNNVIVSFKINKKIADSQSEIPNIIEELFSYKRFVPTSLQLVSEKENYSATLCGDTFMFLHINKHESNVSKGETNINNIKEIFKTMQQKDSMSVFVTYKTSSVQSIYNIRQKQLSPNASVDEKTDNLMSSLKGFHYVPFKLVRKRINDPESACDIDAWKQGSDNSDCWIDSTLFALFANDRISGNLINQIHEKYNDLEDTSRLNDEAKKKNEYVRNVLFCINLYLRAIYIFEKTDARWLRHKNQIKWCIVWYMLKYFEMTVDAGMYQIISGTFKLNLELMTVPDGGDPKYLGYFLSILLNNFVCDMELHNVTNLNDLLNVIKSKHHTIDKKSESLLFFPLILQPPIKIDDKSRYFLSLKNIIEPKFPMLSLEAISIGMGGHNTAYSMCNGAWRFYDNQHTPTIEKISLAKMTSDFETKIRSLDPRIYMLTLIYKQSKMIGGKTKKHRKTRRVRSRSRKYKHST
jgi:hypothetical protein